MYEQLKSECWVCLVLEPDCYSTPGQTTIKEWISFEHKYNCRLDPSLPVKGKVSPRHVYKNIIERVDGFLYDHICTV